MRRRSTAAVALASLVVLVNGCGGADETSPPTTRASDTADAADAHEHSTGDPSPDETALTDEERTELFDDLLESESGTGGAASSTPDDLDDLDGSIASTMPDGTSDGAVESAPAGSAPEPLADGTYFGFITGIDTVGATIGFDVARLLTGADAIAAAIAAGSTDAKNPTVPGGVVVINTSPLTRTLPLAPNVAIRVLRAPTDPAVEPVNLQRFDSLFNLGATLPTNPGLGVHAVVRRGVVIELEQQWLPAEPTSPTPGN